MKISKIKLDNFRSIKKAEISPSAFNIFVGQNNHGKTNFFEAIDWFFNGMKKGENLENIRFGRSGDAEIAVEIEFADALDGANRMKNPGNKTKIINALGTNDTVVVRRSSLDVKKRSISIGGKFLEKTPTGFDNALNDFLPSFEYVSTQINPLEVAKYGRNTPIANMLSGVLTAILENDPTYAAFKKQFNELFTDSKSLVRLELDKLSGRVKIYLEKQFPDSQRVVFEVSQPVFEDLLKNFETSIDDGVYTGVDEKGDGMQRALMLAIIQAYADFRRDNEETSKFFLFFIDEGELHLHPTAQRNLKNALLELAHGGDQIFINTHSSVLVSDETPEQTIFKVEKINKETSVVPIKQDEKPYIVYELLGGSPSDLLLPPNFLIVEGKSEYEFLSRVITRFYFDKKKIQIIYAEGDHERQRQTMEGINKVYMPLFSNPVYKERLVILCDTPNAERAAKFEEFKKAYPTLVKNGQLSVIPHPSLEEYYPAPWKKSAAEVKALDVDKNGKLLLSRQVGDRISQTQFEKDMSAIYEALTNCWTKSHI